MTPFGSDHMGSPYVLPDFTPVRLATYLMCRALLQCSPCNSCLLCDIIKPSVTGSCRSADFPRFCGWQGAFQRTSLSVQLQPDAQVEAPSRRAMMLL